MYAAARRYEGIIDDDEAARLVGDSFMPQVGVDASNRVWVVWSQQVGANWDIYARRFDAEKQEWIEENAPNLFPNPPRVTEGQVVASDTKK